MKKKKIKKIPVLITFIVLIILVFATLNIFDDVFMKKGEVDRPVQLEKEEEKEKVYTSTIAVAGNVLINRTMWYDSKTADSYDFSNVFSLFTEDRKEHQTNLGFYTQQSIIGGTELGETVSYNYNSPTDVGDKMVNAGFNMVSLASYHAFDKGIKGITNSINYWDEKSVVYSGTSINEEDRLKNNIITKNGITYALLSYTMSTDEKVNEPYYVNIYSEELVKKDIESLKDKYDVLIISIDFNTGSAVVTDKQKEVVQYLIDNGANIIVGNSNYSILPIEIIDNTLVFYSLGNLLSGHLSYDSRTSAVVDFKVTLTKKDDNKTIKFSDINVDLMYAYNKDGEGSYKIIPYSKIDKEFSQYKTYYDKYKKLLTEDKDYINVYSIGE